PGASGIDFIAAAKPSSPDRQFMVYTVYDDDARVFEALRAGANGYLLKSASPYAIIEAIRDLRNGGAPMSASVARRLVDHFRPPGNRSSHLLSERENNVLALLAEGLLYKEIADRLYISSSTVKNHILTIYEKLHVQTRTEAVNRYFGR
ncbi:MAG: response regulator transcription factor, partial [Flavobacteriales bacterium]